MTVVTRTDPRESEKLRRQAAGADQGPTERDQDRTNGVAFGSLVRGLYDSQDPTNVSFPFLRRMRRDHVISWADHLIKMPMVRAATYFEADTAQAQAFADNIVRPILGSGMLTILRIIWAGFSPAVINYEVIQPDWTYVEDGVVKRVWDSDTVGVVVPKVPIPLRPESCRPAYDDQGRWTGILWDEAYSGRGGFRLDGQVVPQVDLAHSLWASHDKEGSDGSPFGFPRMAHCAPIFHLSRFLWTLMGRAFENSADPGPVVDFPPDESTTPREGEERTVDTALRIGRRKRSGSTIALSSEIYQTMMGDRLTGQRKWDIRYPKVETNFDAIIAALGMLDAQKFRGMWIAEQSSIGLPGAGSSRNVASELNSQRDASQVVLMRQMIEDVIMRQIVRPAFARNMPWYEGRLEMKTLGFGQEDEDIVRQIFQLVGQQDYARFGVDLRRLAEGQGLPMTDLAEFQREMARREQQAAKIVDQGQPPPVTPTQGKRAFVKPGQFGENVYVQVNDPLDLSSRADGDFVASLLLAQTWEDPVVLDTARALRSSLAEVLSASRMDLSDDDDKAVLHEAVRRKLGCVYQRVAKSEARKLRLPGGAADWSQRVDDLSQFIEHEVLAQIDGLDLAEVRVDEAVESIAFDVAARAVNHARNLAVLAVGEEADVRHAQVLDEGHLYHGQIIDLALAELMTKSMSASLSVRLLPEAPKDLQIRYEVLDNDHLARYDEDAHVVLLSDDLMKMQEAEYLVALGDRWANKT